MKFIHFIDRETLLLVNSEGLRPYEGYQGHHGIELYPDRPILFMESGEDKEYDAWVRYFNQKTTKEEKWFRLGGLRLLQNEKEALGLRVELTEDYFPLKIFLDVRHQFSHQFADRLNEANRPGILFNGKYNDLKKLLLEMKIERYVMDASFMLDTPEDLEFFMDLVDEIGAASAGAYSLRCLTPKYIPASAITGTFEIPIQFEMRKS